jgi:hypothetical protein
MRSCASSSRGICCGNKNQPHVIVSIGDSTERIFRYIRQCVSIVTRSGHQRLIFQSRELLGLPDEERSDAMPFFGLEPFDHADATYHWPAKGQPGFFRVTVRGNAQKFSFGFQLKRDSHFVGGLAIDVMGWTGPLTTGTVPYTVTADFNGSFLREIVVIGTNKTEVIPVKEVEFTTEEAFMGQFVTA